MSKVYNNQSGFSVVEVILVLVIIILVGVVGVMVYKNHGKMPADSVTKTSQTSTKTKARTTDPYAGWKPYTLKYEKLKFQYPPDWTVEDSSASQGLTPNADSVTLTGSNSFHVSINDGWNGAGDPLNLATDNPVPLKFLGNQAYLVFLHPKFTDDPTSVTSALLMTNPSKGYGENTTVGYFPQDKNAHGDPNVNNGGSTMLISAGYPGNSTTFATVDQAKNDPQFKNAILVLQSMHY